MESFNFKHDISDRTSFLMWINELTERMMRSPQPLNILVVDDEEEICRMLAKWLSLEGHRVRSVLTGKEAINHAEKNHYDIVFLDIVMPGIPAIKVLEKIKEISEETNVILVTGQLEDRNLLKEMKKRGAPGILQKPFKIDDILVRIKDHE